MKTQHLTFINIICPGYQKRRDVGREEFNFKSLSDNVLNCPNVLSMLEKAERFLARLEPKLQQEIELKTILADVAILNFRELSDKQEVKKVMEQFFLSIKKADILNFKNGELLKMSEMPAHFRKIPLGGIKPKEARQLFNKAEADIRIIAKEYIRSLAFERGEKSMPQVQKEVERFVAEYGLAGLAIKRIYQNSIMLFTEPSGYRRGYFYNSFLKDKDRLPVLYLC